MVYCIWQAFFINFCMEWNSWDVLHDTTVDQMNNHGCVKTGVAHWSDHVILVRSPPHWSGLMLCGETIQSTDVLRISPDHTLATNYAAPCGLAIVALVFGCCLACVSACWCYSSHMYWSERQQNVDMLQQLRLTNQPVYHSIDGTDFELCSVSQSNP